MSDLALQYVTALKQHCQLSSGLTETSNEFLVRGSLLPLNLKDDSMTRIVRVFESYLPTLTSSCQPDENLRSTTGLGIKPLGEEGGNVMG